MNAYLELRWRLATRSRGYWPRLFALLGLPMAVTAVLQSGAIWMPVGILLGLAAMPLS